MVSRILAVLSLAALMGSVECRRRSSTFFCGRENVSQPLEEVIDLIIEEISRRSKCIVFVHDSHYSRVINFHLSRRGTSVIPVYAMKVRESEGFSPPRAWVKSIISQSKRDGCDAYVILMANPLRVLEFLRHTEKERLIDTRGSFLLIHDWRLFEESSRFLWNRITKVVFVRRLNVFASKHSGSSFSSSKAVSHEWFNLETVYYPVKVKTFVLTRYLDTWYRGKFHRGVEPFASNTADLRGKPLKIAVLEHIPAVTSQAIRTFGHFPTKTKDRVDVGGKALGIEFELIRIIAKKINFQPEFYSPNGIESSKWGKPGENESFDGLLGEAVAGRAAFLIGDLHYTPRHNRLLDLSLPYNTECLTFLTPEALNDNSWKLLIIPFKLSTWIAVILTLTLGACIFHLFALTYRKYISIDAPGAHNETALCLREKKESSMTGLELFTEPGNSIMYTYSMLLQVSLPRIPTAWAVRIFIGWWWLYSILVTVSYRASMTATLANPISRVRIDTVTELVKSRIALGGWTDEQRDLFLSSSDTDVQKIGERFQLTDNEDDAVAQVANGSFCYYENIYVLKEVRALRRQAELNETKNTVKRKEKYQLNRDLHIMQECIIDMPVSIGMDKNSPLKMQVDRTIGHVVEAGLVAKWLSDVTEWTRIMELQIKTPSEQNLVDLHKLHGALVTLGIGYFCSCVALVGEKLHWKYLIQRDPRYDKYQMDIFYATAQKL